MPGVKRVLKKICICFEDREKVNERRETLIGEIFLKKRTKWPDRLTPGWSVLTTNRC